MRRSIFAIVVVSTLFLAIMNIEIPPAYAKTETITLTPTDDTYISSEYKDETYGTSYDIRVGKKWVLVIPSGESYTFLYYGLIRFDVSGIPSNAEIESAELKLTLSGKFDIQSGEVQGFCLQPPYKSWNENTASWNNPPWGPGAGWLTVPPAFSVKGTDPIGTVYTCMMTNTVKNWHDDPSWNLGFLIVGDGEIGQAEFASKENPDEYARPKLVIEYRVPSLSLSISPSKKTVVQGESATYQVNVGAELYDGTVTLSISKGLPAGVGYSFNPTTATPPFTSTLTITTTAATPPGTWSFNVMGQGEGISKTKTFAQALIVEEAPPPGDFDLVLNPSELEMTQGTSRQVTVTMVPLQGYNKPVTLSLVSVPSGVDASIAPPDVEPGGSTTLTIQVSESMNPGTYTLSVKGRGADGREHVESLYLRVTERSITEPFRFSITRSPGSQSIHQGEATEYTIAINLDSGAAEMVTLDIAGLPAGASHGFSKSSGRPSFSSALKIYTSDTTPTGTHTLTITGTGGGHTDSTTATLTITFRPTTTTTGTTTTTTPRTTTATTTTTTTPRTTTATTTTAPPSAPRDSMGLMLTNLLGPIALITIPSGLLVAVLLMRRYRKPEATPREIPSEEAPPPTPEEAKLPPRPAVSEELKDAVLSSVVLERVTSPEEISKRLGIDLGTARRVLKELAEDGEIEYEE